MLALIKDIDEQVRRAEAMLRDGDRPPYFLHGSGIFVGGQLTPVEIALDVPADGDFYAKSLHLCLDGRVLDTSAPSRVPYTPVDWTFADDIGVPTGTFQPTLADIGQVSGLFELLLPEQYSNSPVMGSACFAGRHGYDISDGRTPFSAFAGALRFHTLEFIPRSSSVTVRFTPTYGFANASDDPDLVNEYRITAVMPGYKKVKALK
jgi:hypothetical protein